MRRNQAFRNALGPDGYISSAVGWHHHEEHNGQAPDVTYKFLGSAKTFNELDGLEQTYLNFGTYSINRKLEHY